MQSISPAELVTYLSFFKVPSSPLLHLLEPLHKLVVTAKPQPNYILSFPVICEELIARPTVEDHKSAEKAENLVLNFRKKHIAMEVCSPWSVHAICLPVTAEISWPVWLQGCSVSLWLRVERGCSSLSSRSLRISNDSTPLSNSESDSLSDWGLLSDNWSREGMYFSRVINYIR